MDKLQVIEKVYESINIHRALLICTDMNEMQEYHQELLNKDYPVGFDEDNQNNRLYHIVLITRQYARFTL